jgi:hypothetical protein
LSALPLGLYACEKELFLSDHNIDYKVVENNVLRKIFEIMKDIVSSRHVICLFPSAQLVYTLSATCFGLSAIITVDLPYTFFVKMLILKIVKVLKFVEFKIL